MLLVGASKYCFHRSFYLLVEDQFGKNIPNVHRTARVYTIMSAAVSRTCSILVENILH